MELQILWGFIPGSDLPECVSDPGSACAWFALDLTPAKLVKGVLSAAAVTGRALHRASKLAKKSEKIWAMNPYERGRKIEKMILEARDLPTDELASNNPTIDAFKNGNAISIKSRDIRSGYKKAGKFGRALRKDIRKLEKYDGQDWGGVRIRGSEIKRRTLIVAIPRGPMSKRHYKQMVKAYNYGRDRGVNVGFVVV